MRTRILACLGATLAASVALTAAAQPVASTVIVVGHWIRRGEPPRQLSRPVGYSDLDLRRAADQDVLRHRIAVAARDICETLGAKAPNAANLGRSCREDAEREALADMKVAVMAANSEPPPPAADQVTPQDNPYVAAPQDDTAGPPR